MTILDYSTIRPSISSLKSKGVVAVGRYIGWDSVPGFGSIGKNLTKGEAHDLTSAGISIFLAFEYAPDAAAHGSSQGFKDGQLAKQQLASLGAPPDMGVYFAVDFDIPDYAPALPDTPENAMAKLGPVGHYFKAINDLKYSYEVGGYGGYWAIKRLFDAGLITKGWQTVAWSGGHLDHRAVIYQNMAPAPIPGSDVNVHENAVTDPDFGQWPRPKVTPPGPPPTKPEFPVPSVSVTVSPKVLVSLSDTGSPHYRVQVAFDDNGKPGAVVPGGSVVIYSVHTSIPVPHPGVYWVHAQSAGNSPFSPWEKFTA